MGDEAEGKGGRGEAAQFRNGNPQRSETKDGGGLIGHGGRI